MASPGELGPQGVLPFEGQILDRYERLDLMGHVEGFLPVSREEQTRATIIEPFVGRPGGAAAHLAEVASHQRKAGKEDTLAAPRRITRQMIGWALDAKQSGRTLDELTADLDEASPELILNRVLDTDDTRAHLLPFLRFFDLSTLRETQRVDAVGYDPQKVSYDSSNPGIMHYVGEAADRWRVQQVRRRLPDASGHEAARFGFWTYCLAKVREHYPRLRPIAEEGFDKIYERNT